MGKERAENVFNLHSLRVIPRSLEAEWLPEEIQMQLK